MTEREKQATHQPRLGASDDCAGGTSRRSDLRKQILAHHTAASSYAPPARTIPLFRGSWTRKRGLNTHKSAL